MRDDTGTKSEESQRSLRKFVFDSEYIIRRLSKFYSIFVNVCTTRQHSWLRHYSTSWKITGSIPDEVIGFFNLPNPSSRTMALGSTQPLTEMSTRNLPGGKKRPARKVDNLTAICEPIV
jgi:hypothetical protein